MRYAIKLCACVVTLLLSGCAWVTHRPIAYKGIPLDGVNANCAIAENERNDQNAKGIRYYQSSPYLLVYADGKGGIVWKIYYLPDQTLKMAVQPFNFVSKVSANLTFSKGVLTESAEEIDTTAVPKAILAAVEKMLPLLLMDAAPDRKVFAPRLYKVIVSGDTIQLAGGQGDTQVSVTVKSK